jgi:transcriptional regulator with XRE-family HTH domain
MTRIVTYSRGASIGFKAKRLRISEFLSQQELADMAGVSLEEVDLFEQNMPVRLDTKRKILKELWARRAEK